MKKSGLIFLGAIVLVAGLGPFQPELTGVPHIQAVLAADPANVTAYCPAEVKFTGSIRVSEACTVQYRLIQSDGLVGPPINLFCPAAGIYPVSALWKKLSSSCTGWMAIEILSPVNVRSNNASFTLTCKPKPVVDWTNAPWILLENGDFLVGGLNFGNSQGAKNVILDGQPALPRPGWTLKQWSDQQIVINVRICDLILWSHTYNVAITEGGQPISNSNQCRFRYPLDVENASNPPIVVGQDISFRVWNLPPAQKEFTLAISPTSGYTENGPATKIPVVGWQGAAGCTPGIITATIPSDTVLGPHYVVLLENGKLCSYVECQITVIRKGGWIIKK